MNQISQISRFEALFTTEELWLVNVLFRERSFESSVFSEEESDFTTHFAIRNGLAPLFYRSKYSDCLHVVSKLQLRKEYLFNLGRNTAFQLVADEIVNNLHDNDIPAVLLKGSFLAPYVYGDVALRPMSDIDILVPIHRVKQALDLIHPLPDSAKVAHEATDHHLPPFMLRGCLVEIHKTLFPVNARFNIPVNDIWLSAVKVPGNNALTVNPLHQVIYLAIHVYYSYRRGGLRLGWFYDFKVLLDRHGDEITLFKVQELANNWKVWEPVKLILSLLSVLLPGGKLYIPVSRKLSKTLEEMIIMFQVSEQQKIEYSYGLAWERLWHTRGLLNKAKFVVNALTIEKDGRKQLSLFRVWHLSRNTFKFLRRKVRGFVL